MFERVEQAVERRNRPQILILYLNVYRHPYASRPVAVMCAIIDRLPAMACRLTAGAPSTYNALSSDDAKKWRAAGLYSPPTWPPR